MYESWNKRIEFSKTEGETGAHMNFSHPWPVKSWAFITGLTQIIRLHFVPSLSCVYTANASFLCLVAHWGHCVHLTQVSLLQTQGILLIDLINESLSWFILLRLSCFSAVWSARYRKSSCTQVDLTLVHLSKALSSYSFGTCKWCTRMFVDDDHPQSPGGFYFIGSCLLFCMAKLSWLLSEFGTQARVPQPQTKCKEFSDRGRLGPSTLRGGNPIWEECSQRGET